METDSESESEMESEVEVEVQAEPEEKVLFHYFVLSFPGVDTRIAPFRPT